MDRDSAWTRRTNKSSFSKTDSHSRGFGTSKRYVSSEGSGRRDGLPALTTTTVAPSGGSSAFGLGSGAFAAFGSATKSGKSGGSVSEIIKTTSSSASPSADPERSFKLGNKPQASVGSKEHLAAANDAKAWTLRYTWVMWYRPPAASKNQDYEKSIKPVYRMRSAQEFWKVYAHLRRPSALPIVSDYHFFKDGIRPVWEDEANKKGGKWMMRFKKGVMDRYWDELLVASIGDQFTEASDEVCGMVVSVRNGEDVLSVWTRNDGGRNVKIRETIKRVLSLPADTVLVWKSHDDSIAQKSAVEQARHEKGDKRRTTLREGSIEDREKQATSS